MKKTIVISGASAGIGRAMAQNLSKDFSLILIGRNETRLHETCESLSGDSHIVISVDLAHKKLLNEKVTSLNWDNKELVGVIANHGVGGENLYGDDDAYQTIMNANLNGTYYLINEFLPHLKESKTNYKQIIVTSSILSKLGVPGYSAYCASKAGVNAFVRSWAMEFARENILVNSICPGWVDTAMARNGLEEMAKNFGKDVDAVRSEQMGYVPLGKMSEASEIAEYAEFLMTKNRSITGQSLHMNNGALLF
jgi:NAD(P)-dependent dehydrogenase (short-subunit alcohol dehydrogenase family)